MVIQTQPGAIVARSVWNYRAWVAAEAFAVDEAPCWTRGVLWASNLLKAAPSFKPRPPLALVIGSLPHINVACR